MNRDFKFRAWTGTEMTDKIAIAGNGHVTTWEVHDSLIGPRLSSVDWVIMQFTGLQDKNGMDIYEGDIIKFHYFYGTLGANLGFEEAEHELTGIVEFGMFGWGLKAIKGEHWKGHTRYEDGEGESSLHELCAMNEGAIHEDSFEVIGSVYENPELINPQ